MENSNVSIYREKNRIDLQIIFRKEEIVITIENKIWSGERKNQLNNYKEKVNNSYSEYDKIFIYLAPSGKLPESGEGWISINYELVRDSLKTVLESNIENQEVEMFIKQYFNIIGRYIVGNELKDKCIEIYKANKKILDLIYEYKPNIYEDTNKNVAEKLKEKGCNIYRVNSEYVNFTTDRMDETLPKGHRWGDGNKILMFELNNYKNIADGQKDTKYLNLQMYITNESEDETVNRDRKILFDIAKENELIDYEEIFVENFKNYKLENGEKSLVKDDE
jgi:hypothetical protein